MPYICWREQKRFSLMDLTRAPLHEATSTSLLEHSGKFYLFVCLFVILFVCLFFNLFVCLFSQSKSKQKQECIMILKNVFFMPNICCRIPNSQHLTFTGANTRLYLTSRSRLGQLPHTHFNNDLKKAKSTSLKELTVN